MRASDSSGEAVAWGSIIFGSVFGLLVAVLILVGVLTTTLWWTVAAMALLVLSNALNLRAIRRRRD